MHPARRGTRTPQRPGGPLAAGHRRDRFSIEIVELEGIEPTHVAETARGRGTRISDLHPPPGRRQPGDRRPQAEQGPGSARCVGSAATAPSPARPSSIPLAAPSVRPTASRSAAAGPNDMNRVFDGRVHARRSPTAPLPSLPRRATPAPRGDSAGHPAQGRRHHRHSSAPSGADGARARPHQPPTPNAERHPLRNTSICRCTSTHAVPPKLVRRSAAPRGSASRANASSPSSGWNPARVSRSNTEKLPP